ncbi:MAG: thioesterase family protein [Rhabdochlamydiaceae bacterium]
MLVKIRLRDTDATGVLYFTEQMRLAIEVLEELFSVKEMLEKEAFLLPIVHAEADYFLPLGVGDEVDITPSVQKIGTSSFTLSYRFWDPHREQEVGRVTIVHVAVSLQTKQSVPIPTQVLSFLETLSAAGARV